MIPNQPFFYLLVGYGRDMCFDFYMMFFGLFGRYLCFNTLGLDVYPKSDGDGIPACWLLQVGSASCLSTRTRALITGS